MVKIEGFWNIGFRRLEDSFSPPEDHMGSICDKLRNLENGFSIWEMDKKVAERKSLFDIESALRYFNDPCDPLIFSEQYRSKILELEEKKR